MTHNNPWLGLKPYKEGQDLFGRSEEIGLLSHDIRFNRQTVVYGKSGVGKSSLLNAGIFPVLRRSNMFPVSVRLIHNDKGTDYFKQIKKCVEDSLRNLRRDIVDTEGKKKTIEKLQGSKRELCKAVAHEGEESLWEYFHRHSFYDENGVNITPVIVFDQFEEMFTLCKSEEERLSFFDQLADLVNDIPPYYIYGDTENKEQEDEIYTDEDVFINDTNDLVFVKKAENETSYNYIQEPNYRIVITLREEYLSSLECYTTHIPLLKHNRYCLRSLSDDQAELVIREPIPGFISRDVAEEIICKVTNAKREDFTLGDGVAQLYVDASILSLFLSELYEKKPSEMTEVSLDLVKEIGDDIISNFYESTISQISVSSAATLEHLLVTEDGVRDSIFESRALQAGITKEDLNFLKEKRILHTIPWSGNQRRIELVHDVLCPVIKKRKEQRKVQEELRKQEQKQKQLLEEKEQQRTKENKEYNRRKRLTEHNVLVHKGRQLLDNALDFGENRTLTDVLTPNEIEKICNFHIFSQAIEVYYEGKADNDFVNQQVFRDPLLKDSKCVVSFGNNNERNQTIDGLYGVELKYVGSSISDIHFRGKEVRSDGRTSFDSPIYILGGFCGIHIDYDDKKREIQRTYLDENGNPIITKDGYSIVETQYDDFDNPITIRFYNIQNDEKIPAKHINGNYGFNSVFDKNGNEIERHFVDECGNAAKIITEVYGKRMTYDPNTFLLTSLSNIDNLGKLMPDKDGYVTEKTFYDENGKPMMYLYYDEKDNPWRTPDGTYGSKTIIDKINKTLTSICVDAEGASMSNSDGTFKQICKFNNKRQITEYYSVDKSDYIIETDGNNAITLLSYDEQNRIQTFKTLNKERMFISGVKLDYNKQGTHIIRLFALSENGLGKFEDFDVEGFEYQLNGDGRLPVLQIFINTNKQYTPCDDGYNAIRIWKDDNNPNTKQLYYNIDGTPMCDKNGIYGIKIEHIDNNTRKQINLGADENLMEDNNGVAFSVITETASGVFITSFNKNGQPYAKDEWVYVHQDKELLSHGGYKKTLYVQNSNKEQIPITRVFRADTSLGAVQCMFEETEFDVKGRLLAQYFKDANGNLVGNENKDSYTKWDYDDKNNTEFISFYDLNDTLKVRTKIVKDKKQRITELANVDINNNYIILGNGYCGRKYEYDDEQKTETITYFDDNRNVCNNNEGFAFRTFWHDNIGRTIAQKDMTAEGTIYGNIGFREYIDSERRECAYYQHQEDSQGNIICDDNGIFFIYHEDDEKGRTIKNIYLNENKLPMPDGDGDYGFSIEYKDEEKLTTTRCLDESGLPHNNRQGYGIIKVYKDENGREIKHLYFTADGSPATYDKLLGCYGLSYEYPRENNENCKIIGFLNEKGEITTNKHGYAYREEIFNPTDGYLRVFFYDINRDNIQSLGNETLDYGYAIVVKNNQEDIQKHIKHIISLGKDGYQPTNNACGYAIKYEIYEKDELRYFEFNDANGNQIPDNVGDYGTEIRRSVDGSTMTIVSLNEKKEPHLNDEGYCYCDIITDIAGDQIRIWRDMEGKQVLPKQRFSKKIKNWLDKFKRQKKETPVFNCRQIGAIYDCILGNVESKGMGKKYGLHNTYVLLQYDSWVFGESDTEELEQIVKKTIIQSKHLELLPITLKGSLLQDVGEVIEIDFPRGEIGIVFTEWGINIETLQIIINKLNDRVNS